MKKLTGLLCAMAMVFGMVGRANAEYFKHSFDVTIEESASDSFIAGETYGGYFILDTEDPDLWIDGDKIGLDGHYFDSYLNNINLATFDNVSHLEGAEVSCYIEGGFDWYTHAHWNYTETFIENGDPYTYSESARFDIYWLGPGAFEVRGSFYEGLKHIEIQYDIYGFPHEQEIYDLSNAYSTVYLSGTHNGTITIESVPIPSAVWLLGSGLIGLVGFRKKFRREA